MVIEKNLTFIREAGTTIKISRFVFMSSCYGVWGGSEELWSSTAKYLKQQGHEVYIYKTNVVSTHHRINQLEQFNIPVFDTLLLDAQQETLDAQQETLLGRVWRRFSQVWIINKVIRGLRRCYRFFSEWLRPQSRFVPETELQLEGELQLESELQSSLAKELAQLDPNLVIISQGDNFDGLEFATLCRQMNLPYIIISHKAGEDRWPIDEVRPLMKAAFQEAVRCYFVSQHNLQVTEMQISQKLLHAEVVKTLI
ncbi:hypothetical protein ACE1CD_21610 [Aerosakkonema sp. BLCC-F183]|uniref:hypothetical protein n=1 Tax=Aerosakkonema sp. BLCC-F183 TaxID=3342834 RepID=UPI0035B97ABB